MALYSVRLLRVVTPGTWTTYTVPPGHRAVVRTISAANRGSGDGFVRAILVDADILYRVIPASSSLVYGEYRHVLYEGETLWGFTDSATCHLVVSGYVFNDEASGREQPPVLVDELPEPLPGPAPPL